LPGRPDQHSPSDPNLSDADLDRLIAEALSRRIVAPDLTRAVMGRLGYMRVSEPIVRKRHRAKWMRRVGTAACLSFALLAGLYMHRQTADSRIPSGPTIPAALRDSFESSGERFDRAIEAIRLLEFLPQGGGSLLGAPNAGPRNEERNVRPELQRGNQPPFRWVRGVSHDHSLVV
jgi:hypothetical protein